MTTGKQFTDRQLVKVVDRLIAEENARYLADTELQAQDRLTGQRWGRWLAAEQAAGPTAVVLPVAFAEDVLRALRGEPTHLPVEPSVLVEMLQGHLDKAEGRS